MMKDIRPAGTLETGPGRPGALKGALQNILSAETNGKKIAELASYGGFVIICALVLWVLNASLPAYSFIGLTGAVIALVNYSKCFDSLPGIKKASLFLMACSLAYVALSNFTPETQSEKKEVKEKGVVAYYTGKTWEYLFGQSGGGHEEKIPQADSSQSSWKWPSRSQKTLGPGEYHFVLSPKEITPWLKIPAHTTYNIYLPEKDNWTIYYSDGTIVEIKDGDLKELPEKSLATFKIASRGTEEKHFTITVF